MRQLRLVRLADDSGDLVLESADGLEQFALMVDDTLRAVVHSVPEAAGVAADTMVVSRPMPAPAAPKPAGRPDAEATIGPREIQMRVRAGESPQELADSLGVALEKVMRFAGPVMDERMRITDEARRARARRAGSENEFVVFGEKVDERFAAHGIVPGDVAWDSRRRDDGDWIVAAEWAGGEGRHRAEWLFHRASRSVAHLDDTADDLLSDRPIRPVVPPQTQPANLSAAPPLAPGIVAFPPMPDAHTGPLPRYDEVFDQDAAPEGPRAVPPYFPPPAPSAMGSEEPTAGFEEPLLPLEDVDDSDAGLPARPLASLTNVRKHRGASETEDDKASRARIPSWDDILLGVRRKQD